MDEFTPQELQAIYDDIDEIAENPDAFADTVYELEYLENMQNVFDE